LSSAARRLQRLVSRRSLSRNIASRTTGWNTIEQSVGTQIFVDVRPMDTMAIANKLPIRPLFWRRV